MKILNLLKKLKKNYTNKSKIKTNFGKDSITLYKKKYV